MSKKLEEERARSRESFYLISALSTGLGVASFCLSMPIWGVAGLTMGAVSYLVNRLDKEDDTEKMLDRCKLTIDEEYPIQLSQKENEIGTKYVFSIPIGMSIKDFEKKKAELQQALGAEINIFLENGRAVIQTIEKQFKDKYHIKLDNMPYQPMRYVLGEDRAGQKLYLELLGADTHTLIVGATGSGKSVCINLIITQMIMQGIELSLIDLKACEFVLYDSYKNLKGFAIDEIGANKVLTDVLQEMNSRYNILLNAKCKNYQDYNKKYPKSKIKPRVVVIDEFQSLCDDKATKKLLFMLLTKARASNIIIILSCQNPRHEIVDGKLRDQIKNYIIFRCETPTSSAVATGEQGNDIACKLVGNGRGLLKVKGSYTEFQGYYLSDDEIEGYIKPYNAPRVAQEEIKQVKPNVIPIGNKRANKVKIEQNKAISDIENILDKIDKL